MPRDCRAGKYSWRWTLVHGASSGNLLARLLDPRWNSTWVKVSPKWEARASLALSLSVIKMMNAPIKINLLRARARAWGLLRVEKER